MIKLLVCGSRTLDDKVDYIEMCLNKVSNFTKIDCIISGMAKGADIIAYNWAINNSIETLKFHADWNKHGRAAGHIRNIKMLDEGKPTHVICFMDCRQNPNGTNGSKHMIDIASKANVPVKVINVK